MEVLNLIDYFFYFFKFSVKNNDYITKKNAHFGKLSLVTKECKISLRLHDFYGLSSSGYDNLCQTLGVKNPFKSTPLDKLNMVKEMKENFPIFMNYAIADVISLSQCEPNLLKMISHISKDVLKIKQPNYVPGIKPSPVTCGRLVCDMFMKFLESWIHSQGTKEDSLLARFHILNEKLELNSSNIRNRKKTSSSILFSNMISGASVQSFLYLIPNSTNLYNAFVHRAYYFNGKQSITDNCA